ncbi:hypothetical protein [Alteromonas sp. ASW11-130]|uniref:hypothetical protein n=1 Tax=Alteromonas sp. ASW11-130 TaxID=3015775 RepID=UPI002242B7A8|nr:hypothetical protein [Alteromonas sp. ASW11-130]MCW8090211.1 hypothetical protein [Alteromonas sp. ASW11-130]
MTRLLLFILIAFSFSVAANDFDCSAEEEFLTTTEGMLRSLLLPIDLEHPIDDAKKRINLNDFRLWVYGDITGMVTPAKFEFKQNLVCKIGTRPMFGVTDSFYNKEHAELAELAKHYAMQYNSYILEYVDKMNHK